MKSDQLTGGSRRLRYIEQKDGDIDGAAARIGWVAFSPDGLRAHYRGRTLTRAPGEDVGAHAIQQGTLTLGGNYKIE